jgi:hypothetical protein
MLSAQNIRPQLQASILVNATYQNTIFVFDGAQSNTECCDIIHKYKNADGKWAFQWIKRDKGRQHEFISQCEYDDLLGAKNNKLEFIKDGKSGFWYFNTRRDFFYP